MEIDVLGQRLDEMVKGTLESIPGAMREVALVLIKNVKQRIEQRGEAFDGTMFTPYSTKPMLVGAKSFKTNAAMQSFMMMGKTEKGLKGKRGVKFSKTQDWKTIVRGGKAYHLMFLQGGYKQLREIHGLQTGRKDFYWSGNMLNSVFPQDPVMEGARCLVVYEPNIELERKKMKGLQGQEGKKLLMPSQSEVAFGKEVFMAKIKIK